MEPLLTVPEAAQLLRVSKWTIYRMTRAGLLHGSKPSGGPWRFPESEIRKRLKEGPSG